MNTQPFNADNWEATAEEISLANEAYAIAAETWFDGVDMDDDRLVGQLEKSLADKIGNAFSPGLTAAEIAHWALAK